MRKLCWRCFWEDPFDILDLNLTLWFEANVESLSRRNHLESRLVKVRKGLRQTLCEPALETKSWDHGRSIGRGQSSSETRLHYVSSETSRGGLTEVKVAQSVLEAGGGRRQWKATQYSTQYSGELRPETCGDDVSRVRVARAAPVYRVLSLLVFNTT